MKYNILILSFLIFLSITCINVYAEIDKTIIEKAIFNEMRPVIVSNNSDGWEIKGLYFNSILKERADSVVTWRYEEKGKKIGFMHQKTAWDTGLVIAAGAFPSKGIINSETTPIKVTYDDAIKRSVFGTGGINVEIIQDNYKWQKIIEIESLESLGNIPTNAEYLEISFLIFDDFKIQNGIIEKPILFGENSYLQPVRAWDSSEDPDDESGAVGVVAGNVVTKRIPVAWLKSAVYPVQTDATITYGAENVFNSAAITETSVAALDSTHFVAVYKDGGNSYYGTAIVGLVSGTTISSYGAENVFNSASTSSLSVTALDSTHFVVAFGNTGDVGTAIVGLVSGTTISSYGAENVFNSVSTFDISVTTLDSTHFAVAYQDYGGDNYGCARVGLVSGTTISSYGAENVFNSAITDHISVATLDSTHFVVVYRDDGGADYGCARVGLTNGGTTISSYGAENVFNSADTRYTSVAALDSTHFVVVYRDGGNSYYGTAIVGLVSGTTISSYGAENVFNSATSNYVSVAAINSTYFVVAYQDVGNSSYGRAIIGEVSGITISSFGAPNVFNSAITTFIFIEKLDNTHFVIAYKDVGNSGYGTAIVGDVGELPSTYTPPNPITLINTTGNFWVNHTWSAGSGNVTDSYNVSVNNIWYNTTTDTFYNDTYTAHAWQNITVYAFNTSGAGTLSTGSINQNTQIPNNLITITNTSDWSGNEGQNIYVDYDVTDADSDTPAFSCNRTDLFADFSTSTGKGNWTTGYTDAGTYYIDFGVSDGYGSTSNYTMTIIVADFGTPGTPTGLANTTGNFWVNHTWAAGSGNVTDSYNVSVNDVWHNTSPAYYNDTYAAHAWQNTTVWAYNSTGTGTLSSGSVGQDTQIPNNPITITNTSDWSGDAGETVYVDYDATDIDSDTATFSCDRTDLFTDFDTSTGTGNWTATANIYYVDFGVSDGYGSISNYTMTLTESSVEVALLDELKLIMSEIITGLKSINMGNYLVYAFILIGILLIILLIQILNNCIYRG